jgi:hypothetical protein
MLSRHGFRRFLATVNEPDSARSTTPGNDDVGAEAGPSTSNLPASTDLLEVYRGMVAQGRLAWDPEQVRIVMKVCSSYIR